MNAQGVLMDLFQEHDVTNLLENLNSFNDMRLGKLLDFFKIKENKSMVFDFRPEYIESIKPEEVWSLLKESNLDKELLCFQNQRIFNEFIFKNSEKDFYELEAFEFDFSFDKRNKFCDDQMSKMTVHVDSIKSFLNKDEIMKIRFNFSKNLIMFFTYTKEIEFNKCKDVLNIVENKICLKNLVRTMIIEQSQKKLISQNNKNALFSTVASLLKRRTSIQGLLKTFIECVFREYYFDVSDSCFTNYKLRKIRKSSFYFEDIKAKHFDKRQRILTHFTLFKSPKCVVVNPLKRTDLIFYQTIRYLNKILILKIVIPKIFLENPSFEDFFKRGIKLIVENPSEKFRIVNKVFLNTHQYNTLKLIFQKAFYNLFISNTFCNLIGRLFKFISCSSLIDLFVNKSGIYSLSELLEKNPFKLGFAFFLMYLLFPENIITSFDFYRKSKSKKVIKKYLSNNNQCSLLLFYSRILLQQFSSDKTIEIIANLFYFLNSLKYPLELIKTTVQKFFEMNDFLKKEKILVKKINLFYGFKVLSNFGNFLSKIHIKSKLSKTKKDSEIRESNTKIKIKKAKKTLNLNFDTLQFQSYKKQKRIYESMKHKQPFFLRKKSFLHSCLIISKNEENKLFRIEIHKSKFLEKNGKDHHFVFTCILKEDKKIYKVFLSNKDILHFFGFDLSQNVPDLMFVKIFQNIFSKVGKSNKISKKQGFTRSLDSK